MGNREGFEGWRRLNNAKHSDRYGDGSREAKRTSIFHLLSGQPVSIRYQFGREEWCRGLYMLSCKIHIPTFLLQSDRVLVSRIGQGYEGEEMIY